MRRLAYDAEPGFAMSTAVLCAIGDVELFATLFEGCLEMASRGSERALVLLKLMGASDAVIDSAAAAVPEKVVE